ncbi:MAG: hypothetical protein LBH70_05660 [Spirochaetaceae bacterium]|jgi:hypothetical protein|nr:hypothetical protein [Spirochaetaceae bacterium]
MANEKDPSIYYDRGTVGSSEELDEYGVWVKSDPQDPSSVNNNDTRETANPEEDFSSDLMADLPDFDDVIAELGISESILDMPNPADFTAASADEGTEEPAPVAESADALEEDGLPGIPAEDFLPEPEPQEDPASSPAENSGKPVDLSTQLLMKIVEELSAIKHELSSLKQELSQSSRPSVKPEEQTGGGFFDDDEEEDEIIALTGEELNTILNTAEFTEEAGAPPPGAAADSEPVPFSGGEPETPDEASASPDGAEPFVEDGAAQEDFPEPDDSFAFSAENLEISPELQTLREEGVEPLTPMPEDAGFLEEDQAAVMDAPLLDDLPEDDVLDSSFDGFADDAFSGDSPFEFEDAPVEEPELPDELNGDSLEEPSLENFSPDLDADIEIPAIDDEMEDEALNPQDDGGSSANSDNEHGPDDGGYEEIELTPDDSGGADEIGSGEFSLDGDLLDSDDFSIDDFIDMPSADDAQGTGGDALDDGVYDQVIPEGFLVEPPDDAVDIPSPEENAAVGDVPESVADFPAAEDILEPEAVSEDTVPVGIEPVPEEAEVGETPPEEETAGEISPPVEAAPQKAASAETPQAVDVSAIPSNIKVELRSVLSYMDQLLESLPEDKIEEFAKSAYFDTYKKLFEDLGLA